MKYLTAQESKQVKGAARQRAVNFAYAELPPISEFIAAALAGAAKRGWYANAKRAIEAQYGPDAPRFSALLAALSPRVSLQTNVKNAVAAFERWKSAGRPTTKQGIVWNVLREAIDGELLGAWIPNAVAALSSDAPALSGPKVDSFYRNLSGDLSAVTCDAWIATFAGIEQKRLSGKRNGSGPGKSAMYLALSQKVRLAAAALLGWAPAEVQECIWAFTKTAYETASSGGPSVTVESLVRHNALTEEIIGATPDVHTLFSVASAARINSDTLRGDTRYLLRIAKRLDAKLAAARDSNQEPNF